MRKLVFIIFIAFFTLSGKAHSVLITVDQFAEYSNLDWNILDTTKQVLVSSDTITDSFYIEANKRFFFQIHIDSISETDTALYMVSIGDEPIMYFSTDLEKGEHSYPFFTGFQAPELRIIGGSDADIEDFPWQIYFASGDYMCGGSIISSKWILTAAHCTKDEDNNPISASDMYVVVGATNPYSSSQGEKYYVKSYTAHINYDTETLQYDLALLELYDEIDFENAEAIELITEEDIDDGATDPGVVATVTGWGLTNAYNTNSLPYILQQVELPIVSNSTAAMVWGYLDSKFLMAGYRNGGKDACSGDSGGPLVVESNGKKKLAGIVSFGSSNCDTYGGYTRVSSYLDWIQENADFNYLSSVSGENTLCNSDSVTQYVTDSIDADSYEWDIEPDSAGSLQYTNHKCNVTWDADYFGEVTISVRALTDTTYTNWVELSLEKYTNASILSYSNDTSVCQGENIILSTKAEGEDLEYNWYLNNEYQLSTYNGSYVDEIDSGMYYYYCKVTGPCNSVLTDSIEIEAIPTTNITTIFKDTIIEFNSDADFEVESFGDNLSYIWYKDNEPIEDVYNSILSFNEINANDIGLYQVKAIGTCESDTSNTFYVYVESSLEDEQLANIWPNFTNSTIHIAFNNDNLYSVKIINMRGEVVYWTKGLIYNTEIDLSNLAEGKYSIIIVGGGEYETHTIINY